MANYRNVYKSDHLGVIDLEELIESKKGLIFTITHVKQEIGAKVAGVIGDFNIAYFKEQIKPLVLNATNAGIIRKLAGGSTNTDNWKNILVELYIDTTVKMKGQIVGGVRIKSQTPIIKQISDSNALSVLNKSTTSEELRVNWLSLTKEEQSLVAVISRKEALKVELNGK